MPANPSRVLSLLFLAASITLVVSCSTQVTANPSETTTPAQSAPTQFSQDQFQTTFSTDTLNGSATITVPIDGDSTVSGDWKDSTKTVWQNNYLYEPQVQGTSRWQVRYAENQTLQEDACRSSDETILLGNTPLRTGFDEVDSQNPVISRWVQPHEGKWEVHMVVGVPAEACPATHGVKTSTGTVAFHLQDVRKKLIAGETLPTEPAYLTFPTKKAALNWVSSTEAETVVDMLASLRLHGVPADVGGDATFSQ